MNITPQMQQFLRMFLQGQNGGNPRFVGGQPGTDKNQAALMASLGMSGPIRRNTRGEIILPGNPGTGETSALDSPTFAGLDAYHAMQRDPATSASRFKQAEFGMSADDPNRRRPAARVTQQFGYGQSRRSLGADWYAALNKARQRSARTFM